MGGQQLYKNGTNIQKGQAILSAQLHNENHMLWPEGLTITLKLIRVVYLHGQRRLVGYSPWGSQKESDVTDGLNKQ